MSRIETSIHLREVTADGRPFEQSYRAWVEDRNHNGRLFDDPLEREDGTVFSVEEIQLYRLMYLAAGGAPSHDSFELWLRNDGSDKLARMADIFADHPDTYKAIGADERAPIPDAELLEYILFDFTGLDADTPLYEQWLNRLEAGTHGQGDAVLGIVESNAFIAATLDEVAKLEFSSFIARFNDANDDGLLYDAEIEVGDGPVHSAEAAQLYRLYLGALGRIPEAEGFFWWLDKLESGEVSLVDVAEGFLGSSEMIRLMDVDQSVSVENGELLDHLYHNILDRAPDEAGRDWWMHQLESGEKKQAEVIDAFAQSNEFAMTTLHIVGDYHFMDVTQL